MANQPAASNITWQPDPLGRSGREARAGHRGCVVWLTGLSGSGKTSIARGVAAALAERGARAYVLDAENVRHGLNADLGFSPEDRAEHVRRLAEVARLFADAATLAVVACIAPRQALRDRVRAIVGADLLEVHVATPLAVCEARDPRGLYRRARAGEIPDFTGISAPWEPPADPDLTVPAGEEPLEASVARVMAALDARGLFEPGPPRRGEAT